MHPDDRDDPFDEFFEEIERMMNNMMNDMQTNYSQTSSQQPNTHIDIQESEDSIRVVADLPGVEKSDLDIQCNGEVLSIHATGQQREYSERVSLPTTVDEHSATANFNNGILEVTFDKMDDSANIHIE
ncbi:MAG: Hsp20/alpha crystallin family protein [Halobacteriaceae archaeon]